MKPAHGPGCSCTSCVGHSESERASVQQFIEDGSKIDKLFLGKYIPLRERKLLGKLVKTRAVYDDIRTELLSGSSTSVPEKSDLRPKRRNIKENDGTERSSAILELVNLVDRGKTLSSGKLSECCSCCICTSDGGTHEHFGKAHRHHRPGVQENVHVHHHHRRQGRRGSGNVTSQSNVADVQRRRPVRFKGKHIRSVPCTTCSFHSKTKIKGNKRSDKAMPVMDADYMPFDDNEKKRHKGNKARSLALKSYQKLKQSQTQMKRGLKEGARRSMKKLHHSKSRLKRGLKEGASRSLKKLERSKTKLKKNLQEGARKSMEKVRIKNRKMKMKVAEMRKSMQSSKIPGVEENKFKIKKDSIVKFKEKLQKKIELDDGACEHECDPEECNPEECFKILTRNRERRAKQLKSESSVNVQATYIGNDAKVGTSRKVIHQGKKSTGAAKPQINVTISTNKEKDVGGAKKDKKTIAASKGKHVGTTQKEKEIKQKKNPVADMCICDVKKSVKSMTAIPEAARKLSLKTSSTGTVPEKNFKHKNRRGITTNGQQQTVQRTNASESRGSSGSSSIRHSSKRHSGRSYSSSDLQSPTTTGSKSRQAVRIGSSFSFSVEFYKDKPSNAPESEFRPVPLQRSGDIVKKKHKGHQARKPTQHHRTSEARLKKIGKDGHALKRCFCTLKLKSKKTKPKITKSATKGTSSSKRLKGLKQQSTESIQTKKLRSPKTLKPYECEPGICVPGECDPYECEKRIQRRGMKLAHTNTTSRTRSTSSITKSVSSGGSKGTQASSSRKAKKLPRSSQTFIARPKPYAANKSRQAVRIGSAFSFSIEFYKDKLNPNNQSVVTAHKQDYSSYEQKPALRTRKRDRGMDRKEVRHTHSQQSSSAGKSKYSSTNHSLRRCFCTLKLKPKAKPHSTSKGSMTSRQQKPKMHQHRQTTTKDKKESIQRRKLLPYECEPGICVPDECDPYECLKIINKRDRARLRRREKKSNTTNRRTRSASSVTSRSFSPSKTKRVQSTVVNYNSAIPARKYRENVVVTKKMPKEVRTSPSSPQRQAVKFGSSFSFDVEFSRNKISVVADKNNAPAVPLSHVSPAKNFQRDKRSLREQDFQDNKSEQKNRRSLKDHIFQDNKSEQKSRRSLKEQVIQDVKYEQKPNPMQVDKKDKKKGIGSALVKCLCILTKSKKESIGGDMSTIGTKTSTIREKPNPSMATKGTKTKDHKHQECDPYVCLEKIKRRNQLKEFGTSTGRRMRSASSLTQNSSITSGTNTNISRNREQKTSTKHRKIREISPPSQRKITSVDSSLNRSRPAVKVGSQFSFNIEFFKDKVSNPNNISVHSKKPNNEKKTQKIKNVENPRAKQISISHQESQAESVKQTNTGTGIKPILKRCFCTLKLRDKYKAKMRPPNVYTVSRVTVEKTKITRRQKEMYRYKSNSYYTKKKRSHLECVAKHSRNKLLMNSHSSLDSKTFVQFKPTDRNQKSVDSHLRLKTVDKCLPKKHSKQIIRITSNFSYDIKCLKGTTQSIFKPLHMKDTTCDIQSLRNNQPYQQYEINNSNVNQLRQVNLDNAFLRTSFCTMNINTDTRRHKLKSCECEPSDKLNMRRLMRKSSKVSDTYSTRSTSSYTSNNVGPVLRRKGRQSSIRLHSTKTTHAREPVGGIIYKTMTSQPQKQAVRAGSSFSFDLEFRKDKDQPATQHYYHPQKSKIIHPQLDRPVRNKYYRTRNKHNHINRDSQSRILIIDSGSSMSPKLKRCFCTLKLQKRERKRQEKTANSYNINNQASTMTPRHTRTEVFRADTHSTGQNTKSNKFRGLDPNECEPGICIPGECDPNKCLELIKRRNRKYRNTGTTSTGPKSSSSSTEPRKQRKTHTQPDNRRKKSSGSAAVFKEPVKSPVQPMKQIDQKQRQAVRIGSTFSFSIEFYKDRFRRTDSIQAAAAAIKSRPRKPKPKKPKKIPKTSKGSNSKSPVVQSRDSQSIPTHTDRGSSTSPRLKRCFCTLNLKNQGTKTRPFKPTPTLHTRSMNTKKLKPYECEPGVCVPGECDPYDCDKLIQKRLRREFGTSTGHNKTKSMGSTSSTKSRAKKLQHNVQPKTQQKPVQSKNEKPPVVTGSARPAKQAVRVGSSFSFNIEFFKEKGKKGSQVSNVPIVRYEKPKEIPPPIKRASEGTSQDRKGTRSTESQMTNISRNVNSTMTELKRCFCTLSLKKPNKTINPKSAPQNKPMPYRAAGTTTKQIYRLEPYECEPHACIPYPGACDPYVCLERIKKRQKKELGTSTGKPRMMSTGSSGSVSSSTKAKKVQFKNASKTVPSYTSVKAPRETIIKQDDHKQAVRLGSNFSFDIEFFKDKSFNEPIVQSIPPPRPKIRRIEPEPIQKINKRSSRTSTARKINTSNKKIQPLINVRDTDSQAVSQKTQSIKVSPFLKRCFCTLGLQKGRKMTSPILTDTAAVGTDTKGIKVILPPKINTADRATRTSKKIHKQPKLLSYECEPGVCIPGECNPQECWERIKRRGMQSRMSGTDKVIPRSTSSFTGESGKTIHTQSKFPPQKDHATSNNQHIVEESRFKSIENPFRQSVRISSSFSFNIEFYKGAPLPSPREKTNEMVPVSHTAPAVPHREHTESIKTKSRGVCSKGLCPRNRQIQSTDTKNTSTGVGPLLKRCFCTLKLQKKGNMQTGPDTKSIKTITSKHYEPKVDTASVAVGTKKKYTKLLPYECEPGVCIPGECDPYECLKRIKNRREISVGPTHAMNKSAGTSTCTKKAKCIEIQCYKDPRKSRNTQCSTKAPKDLRSDARSDRRSYRPPSYPTRTLNSDNRQSLRLGSNFSCSIEFFKDFGGLPSFSPPKMFSTKPRQTSIVCPNPIKCSNKGQCSRGNMCNQKSQMTGVSTESKGSGMVPKLKRCFCTLKLQKSPYANRKEVVNFLSLYVKPPLNMADDNKIFSNKSTHNPCNVLNASKYESQFNTFGRNKYENWARMKKPRRIKTQLFSKALLSSKTKKYIPTVVPKNVDQFNVYDGKTNKKEISNYLSHSHKLPRVNVCENAILYHYDTKSKICQNFNKCAKACTDKSNKINSRLGEKYINEDKSSGLNKILKKCLCTLKILKKDIRLKTTTSHRRENGKRTGISERKNSPFYHENVTRKKRNEMCSQDNRNFFTKNKIVSLASSLSISDYKDTIHKNKRRTLTKEMKTILPYIPYKYNKHNSNILLPNNNKQLRACSPLKYHNCTLKIPITPKNNVRVIRSQVTAKRQSFTTTEDPKTQNKFSFRNVINRCKQFFIKSHEPQNISISLNNYENSKDVKLVRNKRPQPLPISTTDVLKTSKSDRRPTDSNIVTIPKKSQSLKITKVPLTDKVRTDHINYIEQGTKKYSRFQSGDAGPNQINPRAFNRLPMSHKFDNEVLCYYCQILHNKDNKCHKIKENSPFNNNKVVQLALTTSMKNKFNNFCEKPICETRQEIIAGNIPGPKNDSICINDPAYKHSAPKSTGILKNSKKNDKCYCPMPCLQFKEPNQNCPKKTKVVVLHPICDKVVKPIPRVQCTSKKTCACCRGGKFKQDDSGDCPGNLDRKCKTSCAVENATKPEGNKKFTLKSLFGLDNELPKKPEPCETKNVEIPCPEPRGKGKLKIRKPGKSVPNNINVVQNSPDEMSEPCDICDDDPKAEMNVNSKRLSILSKSKRKAPDPRNTETLEKSLKPKKLPPKNTKMLPPKNTKMLPPKNTKMLPPKNTKMLPPKNAKMLPPKNTKMLPPKNTKRLPPKNTKRVIIKKPPAKTAAPNNRKKKLEKPKPQDETSEPCDICDSDYDTKVEMKMNSGKIDEKSVPNNKKGGPSAPCDTCDYDPMIEMKMNSKTMAILNRTNPLCKKAIEPVPVVQCKTKDPCTCCSGSKKKRLSRLSRLSEPCPEDKETKCLEICTTEDSSLIKNPLKKFYERLMKKPDPCDTCDYNPLLEMKMDSGSMAILNSTELLEGIKKLKIKKGILSGDGGVTAEELKTLHGKSCNCCICQSYRKSTPPMLKQDKNDICICGSLPCSREVAREKAALAEEEAARKKKPCVCGTKICERESLKMALQSKAISRKQGRRMKKNLDKKLMDKKKRAEIDAKVVKAKRDQVLRQKRYKKEDAIRKKQRAKRDKYEDKQVLKNKNADDCYLVTESALDVGKFGFQGLGRMLRGTSRAMLDPKNTYQKMKSTFEDPRRALANMSGSFADSGAGSTARRVKTRIASMRCVYNIKECLESYPATNYLLHMCDKDPKARMMKKRRKRRRVPVDFECSLYMASLRKKPWLSVYHKCPWFYTHCISMLNIIQQFTDVLLFILAVLVWSPLLCAMEVCRACMCCTLCTG